jgi:tRNA(fMet)-specific endonuclease VapC
LSVVVADARPFPRAVVVDTDVVSFLFRNHTLADRYRPHLIGRVGILSAQTLAELDHWPERAGWGQRRRRELESFLASYVVENPDRETCRIYGRITAAARRAGFVVPPTDAWHAATALRLNIPLVTHNARNFRGVPDLVVIAEPEPSVSS